MSDESSATPRYITLREPPMKRKAHCVDGIEHNLSEGAVMVAFGMYLLEQGATEIRLHPDGEHLKRYDPRAALQQHGFRQVSQQGRTPYGGIYTRGTQSVTIIPRPGLGDVVTELNGRMLLAECKGGVVNSRHAGQVSRLRRGLCEAIGLLMTRARSDERHVAVVPRTDATVAIARRTADRAAAAGIEIALVDGAGNVEFVGETSHA